MTGPQLVTVLAHDVRNLLTPLIARIDLVRRRAVRDGRAHDVQDLEIASRTALRLTRLMVNLLDVARLESGAFAITAQPVEMVSLVQETVSTFESAQERIQIRASDEVEA